MPDAVKKWPEIRSFRCLAIALPLPWRAPVATAAPKSHAEKLDK
jgi:hypothetical protein